ncbi:hypothetical protein Tco_0556777 [Tanacetum coccineum]
MACSIPHSDDEIQALVQKQIDEDMVHQKAIMDLALQFDNACTTKEDLRKPITRNLSNSICVEPSFSTPNSVRIIPGPTGLVQRAKLLKENVFILDPDGALMSTQEYMQKVVEDVGEDADFNSRAWVSATNYVNAFCGTVIGYLEDIDNFLKKGKFEQVVAIVKS